MKKWLSSVLAAVFMVTGIVPAMAAQTPLESYLITSESPGYAEDGAFADSGLSAVDNTQGRFCSNAPASITYTPELQQTGMYKVYVYVVKNPNLHNAKNIENAIVTVKHADGFDKRTMNFDVLEGWQELGTYKLYAGTRSYVKTAFEENENKDGQIGSLRAGGARFDLIETIDEVPPPEEEEPLFGDDEVLDIPALQETADGITVLIDGALQVYDQPPVLVNDRTLVPMRGIFEALEATVFWDDATSTVTAVRGTDKIVLTIGNSTAYINDTPITLDVAPQLINDRTLVPVRFISESLGAEVTWKEESQQVCISTGKEPRELYVFGFSDFKELGTWTSDSYQEAFLGANLRGLTEEGEAKPAILEFVVDKEGDYELFVRTRGFTTDPEARYFNVSVNDVTLSKTFGQHGVANWQWESGGVLHLKEGRTVIKLLDTSMFYARADAVLLTPDPAFKDFPTDDETFSAYTSERNGYDAGVYFPQYAADTTQPAAEKVSIQNEHMTIDFYTVPTELGNIIQKETYVNGEKITGRENHLGNLLMYATEASAQGESAGAHFAQVTYSKKGSMTTTRTSDVFSMGKPYWLIPNRVEILADNKAELYASCDVADAVATWELLPGEQEPSITFKLLPKTAGAFTVQLLAGTEKPLDDTSFVLSPIFDVGKKLPNIPQAVTERYASVPLSCTTYPLSSGEKVTVGVAIDPTFATTDWVVEENARFGFGIRSAAGNVMPALVAPLQGSEASIMQPGDSYTITYRLLETKQDWFDTFSHVVTDLYGLKDYRQNYFGGLTDTILNAAELALDPLYSGWDEKMMLHYNIEGQYSASQANPMVYLTSYLLSEDENMLTERAIPSIAYLLTRPGLHFTRSSVKGTGNPGLLFDSETPIGKATTSFGTSVLGGIYGMTQGYNDVFSTLAYGNGPVYYNAYGSTPKFTEYAWAYRFTGNTEYLETAKQEADALIEKQITNPMSEHPDFNSFIAISYYPNFQALLDLYEICGEQKYLDAAVEAAHQMMTTVWVNPVPDQNIFISGDTIRNQHHNMGNMNANFYYDHAWRIGYPENLDKIEDQDVPFWLVSRTGLSIEQATTYRQHNSGNMIMANWAADLMRLYSYTGDPLFETYARNAVIGRYTNYPGYYYTQYDTTAMQPDYPYEGPDITGIYWHHIPPFLSMVQDFLFTQAIAWSDRKIDFPSVRQQGYAYFSSREYGGQPGNVFDMDNMWLWLKDGLVIEDNLQIDWFAARKDGTAAIVLMNQGKNDETFALTLGADMAGGNYTGAVRLYDSAGNVSAATMENGKITLTVPGHSLAVLALDDPKIQAPAFADVHAESLEGTTQAIAAEGDFGSGYLLQVTPSMYHAYLYTEFTTKDVSKVVFEYKIGDGEWQSQEVADYPFETILHVTTPTEPITFRVKATDLSGAQKVSAEKTLVPKH